MSEPEGGIFPRTGPGAVEPDTQGYLGAPSPVELGACPACGGTAQFIDPDKVRSAELSADCVRDVRYLLDIGHWGKAHFAGCATVRNGDACTCSLGRIRRQYNHWPENGCPVTEDEWTRQRGERA